MNVVQRLAFVGVAAAVVLGVAVAPASAENMPVSATKASVAAWVDQAGSSAMTTRVTSVEESSKTCTIDASQASDCILKVPGNPDSQTVTNADATRKWFRDLPNGKWKTNKFAAGENPVTEVDRFYSYNPYEPWTADATLGVTWSMKAKGNQIVIRSTVKELGEDQTPVNIVTINKDGSGFSIVGKDLDGTVVVKTVGKMAPDTTKVVVPPAN